MPRINSNKFLTKHILVILFTFSACTSTLLLPNATYADSKENLATKELATIENLSFQQGAGSLPFQVEAEPAERNSPVRYSGIYTNADKIFLAGNASKFLLWLIAIIFFAIGIFKIFKNKSQLSKIPDATKRPFIIGALLIVIGMLASFTAEIYARATCPDQVATNYSLAACHATMSHSYAQAVEYYSHAIELKPGAACKNYLPFFYFCRASAYNKLGQYDKAIADYNKTLELDPNYYRGPCARDLTYINSSQYQKAIQNCTAQINEHKEETSIETYTLRALAYAKLGQYQKTIDDCNVVITANKNIASENSFKYPLVYNLRARCYALTKQYDKAIADCTEAIAIDNYNQNLPTFLGMVNGDYLQLNPKRPCSTYFEPGPLPAIYIERGVLYEDLGKYQEAINDLSQAIHIMENPPEPHGKYSCDTAEKYLMYNWAHHFRAIAYDKLGKKELADKDRKKGSKKK